MDGDGRTFNDTSITSNSRIEQFADDIAANKASLRRLEVCRGKIFEEKKELKYWLRTPQDEENGGPKN
jgi:hypothetical protein